MNKRTRLTIEVTEDLISKSTERDSGHCMVSEAVKQSVPGATWVSSDLQTIRFSLQEEGKRYIYLTPRSAQEALIDFDQGRKPEPFSFQLRNPQVKATESRTTRSASQRAKRKDDLEKVRRAKLVNGAGENHVPTKVGGKSPPTGPLAGGAITGPVNRARRRKFGIRALDR